VIDLDALKSELATSPWWIDGGMTNRDLDAAMAIIARHGAPVVTPDPPAEVRDVLAEGLQAYAQQFSDHPVLPMYTGHADAGLAALRERGFAVVRTADVKAALGLADVDSRWPSDAMIRLEEATR